MKKLLLSVAMLLAVSAFATEYIVVVGGEQACDFSLMNWNKGKHAPKTGWCEALKGLLADDVKIINWAGGRSTKVLLDSGYWSEHIVNTFAKGRYVILTFGIEDASTHKDYHTEPFKDFAENLKTMLMDVEERGAIPLLVGPVIRCTHGGGDGRTLSDNELFNYSKAMLAVAKENNLPYVDLTQLTYDYFKSMSPEQMKKYFMFYGPGEEKNYPKGIRSIAALNKKGADKVAELFVEEVKRQQLPIAKSFK